jgi:hypothetical protein
MRATTDAIPAGHHRYRPTIEGCDHRWWGISWTDGGGGIVLPPSISTVLVCEMEAMNGRLSQHG